MIENFIEHLKKLSANKHGEPKGQFKLGGAIRCLNPQHADKHPSMIISKNDANCISCGHVIKNPGFKGPVKIFKQEPTRRAENNNLYPQKTTARREGQSKEEYLYYLTNKLGCDVELAYNWYDDENNKYFTKWISFLTISKYKNEEWMPGTRDSADEFIKKATHRSVLDIEIMIDIDEPGNFTSIEEKGRTVCKYLDKNNIKYSCYFSGSKSYHISILRPEIRHWTDNERYQYKKELISAFVQADSQKASSRNMIAFEGEPHWKTGTVKKEVRFNG